MARTDIHLDAMLRHLGAAYYESLHGRATRLDVTRALDTVAEHLDEQASHHPPARPHRAPQGNEPWRRRWARRVSDVMTTSVVTVDRITPYQEIDRLLTQHKISGMPVLKMGREVAGVVSEADLLAAEDETSRRARMASSVGRRWRPAAAAAREPDRRDADDRSGHHHQPRRDHPGRGAADEHAPRQEAASGRRGREAGRHRQPPRPAQRLPTPG